MKNENGFEKSKQDCESQKDALRDISLVFAGWLIENGYCPEDLRCWVCREMKPKEEFGSLYYVDLFAEPICIPCTNLSKLLMQEHEALRRVERKETEVANEVWGKQW